ncbi:MAG: DegQ family serine endoprotease [bacterium]|nr:DegQ family serine endoprotease [bacterium]
MGYRFNFSYVMGGVLMALFMIITPYAQAADSLVDLKATSRAFNRVAEAGIDAVVNISATQKQPQSLNGYSNADPFDFFFGDDLFKHYFQQPSSKQTSLGSGVLVDNSGYILTNHHVVDNAADITVTLSDKNEFSATLVGSDPRTDVAVLKIKPESKLLPAIQLGDSDTLRVGDWAIAIGSPFGLSKSMTVGIISATGRSNVGIVDYENFIQTDAAINPGNSGGALLDIDGQLIGINTAIFTKSGGYNGIGFAIPINLAKKVMTDLIEHGHVIRGWIGVIIQPITPELSQQLTLDSNAGALIGDLVPNGPADTAGIRRGDVITHINDTPIDDYNDLRNRISQSPVGQSVQLTLIRKKKTKTVSVTVDRFPDDVEQTAAANQHDTLGIRVEPIQADAQREFNVYEQSGLVITQVAPDGPAAGILETGDVLLEINNTRIDTLSDYAQTVAKLPAGKNVLLWIRRGRYSQYVVIRPK